MTYQRPRQESTIMDSTIKKVTKGLPKQDADYIAEEVYKAQFF